MPSQISDHPDNSLVQCASTSKNVKHYLERVELIVIDATQAAKNKEGNESHTSTPADPQPGAIAISTGLCGDVGG
jgi:hypothetical protein